MNIAISLKGSKVSLKPFPIEQESSVSRPDMTPTLDSHISLDLDSRGSACTDLNEFSWIEFRNSLRPEINLAAMDIIHQSEKDFKDHRNSPFPSSSPSVSRLTAASVDENYFPSANGDDCHKPPRQSRKPAASRNAVADSKEQGEIASLCVYGTVKFVEIEFKCPVNVCRFHNGGHPWRATDFRRHLATHLPSKGCRCIGVRLVEASGYSISPDKKAYPIGSEQYIGGCMRIFSRPDALKRHLDNDKTSCISLRVC